MVGIYSRVIDKEYNNNYLKIINFLNTVIDAKCDFAGMSSCQLPIIVDIFTSFNISYIFFIVSMEYMWKSTVVVYGEYSTLVAYIKLLKYIISFIQCS